MKIFGNRSIGIEPWKFVKIFQGQPGPNGEAYLVGTHDSHYESFKVYDVKPECSLGESVYMVREDGTLLRLEEKADTSD